MFALCRGFHVSCIMVVRMVLRWVRADAGPNRLPPFREPEYREPEYSDDPYCEKLLTLFVDRISLTCCYVHTWLRLPSPKDDTPLRDRFGR